MFSSLVENEEGRRISGMYSIQGDIPDQVNSHAATMWEIVLLQKHYDPNVASFARELSNSKTLNTNQKWREVLKRDYTHRIFTEKKTVTQRKMEEESDKE